LDRRALPGYGWFGLGTIVLAEVLLFQGVALVATFFTAIVWTGYILLVDGLVWRIKGESLIRGRAKEMAFLAFFSIPFWLIFEAYNFHLNNWAYINLPESIELRWLGYAWAFATILPCIFETAELVQASGRFGSLTMRPLRISEGTRQVIVVVGFFFSFMPLAAPSHVAPYLFGFVWVGFALFLDPFNYSDDVISLLKELEGGRLETIASFCAAGLICGVLWEFWNYWAYAKWIYTVPIMQNYKIFEMPLPGYLGFPAFALECLVAVTFVRSKLLS
jgi:hypothetical protein